MLYVVWYSLLVTDDVTLTIKMFENYWSTGALQRIH